MDCDDDESAVKTAAKLWRELPNTRRFFFRDHSCFEDGCSLVHVRYFVRKTSSGSVQVRLAEEGEEGPCGRIPLFGCVRTGFSHACGSSCDGSDEQTCRLTGISVSREEIIAPVAPIFYISKLERVERPSMFFRAVASVSNVRSFVLDGHGRQFVCSYDNILGQMRRSRVRTKIEAYDVAFAISCIIFSRSRMKHLTAEASSVRERLETEARKQILRMRVPPSRGLRASILEDRVHVLLLSEKDIASLSHRYAEYCVRFWWVLRENGVHTDSMSFRDFCLAATSLLGIGFKTVDWTTNVEVQIVDKDPLMTLFGPDRWCVREAYSGRYDNRKKLGRARKTLSNAIILRTEGDRLDPAYLDWRRTSWDEIPEKIN